MTKNSVENLDRIEIVGLKAQGILGVYPEERHVPREIIVDFTIYGNQRSAALSDDVNQTVDYDAMSQEVRQLIANSQFELVESLAQAIANHILNHSLAYAATVRVHKRGAVDGTADVMIQITREKESNNRSI
ncbi:MAG: dihydroneopterin aldolase [Spirochaetales bacterium]|nr:dihydroneopterin aldolase [Spirochaetales bacterium]